MTRIPDAEPQPVYVFGPFRLDVAERRLERDGTDIALTRKTFELLLALIERAGRLQTREALIETLWPDTIVEEHSLTWHLSALRRALGDTGDAPTYIETVRGHGYRFVAPVGEPPPPEAAPAPAPMAAQTSGRPFSGPVARGRGILSVAALALAAVAVAAGLTLRPTGRAAVEPTAADASPHSLAVLPFENLSTDPGNAYFVSGIEDIILAKLAGIADLRVVSRRSTETYESRPADLRAVAAQLNVAAVLEGSVQKDGDRVLITVQLIGAENGDHLWGQTYTRTLDNVFQIESDVAEQVAAALKAKLLPAEAARVASVPTRDTQAYDTFLRAEYIAAQIESETAKDPVGANREARRLYEEAVQRDPTFALAHARLSYLHSRAYWYDIDHSPQAIAAAEREADLAMSLQPDLPQSLLALGYVRYYAYRDYTSALAAFERARQGWPSNSDIDAAIASIHRRQGRWDDAIAGFERAAVYDPRNPRWPSLLGDTLAVLRRYDEAGKAYDRAQAADPDDYAAAIYKSLTLVLAGKLDEADRALAALPRDADPGGVASALRFEVARIGGDADAALAAIASAPEWIEAPYAPSFAPVELLRAQALELKNDQAGARAAFAQARDKVRALLADQPDNPGLLSLAGLAEAGLGEKDAAIRDAHRAVELLPVTTDALDAPAYIAAEAEVRVRVGDNDGAMKLLRELLAMPAGRVMSAALIERDVRFQAVRAQALATL